MKFGYKEYQTSATEAFPGRTKIYRPIIPIQIEHGTKKIGYEVLLDSGADWNLFHSVIGEIIGIDVPKGKRQPFGGIGGGDYLAYFHEVTIFIGGWPIKVACGFSDSIPNQSIGVLGHFGFFDRFTVKFETNKHEIEVKQILHLMSSKL